VRHAMALNETGFSQSWQMIVSMACSPLVALKTISDRNVHRWRVINLACECREMNDQFCLHPREEVAEISLYAGGQYHDWRQFCGGDNSNAFVLSASAARYQVVKSSRNGHGSHDRANASRRASLVGCGDLLDKLRASARSRVLPQKLKQERDA
jgi:hypothetical protein